MPDLEEVRRMCSVPPLEGFYGYIISLPLDDPALLWTALFAPPLALFLAEVARFMQPDTRLLSLPVFRFPEASTKVQTRRWYLSQLALLYLGSGVFLFIELPTERAWGRWMQQVHQEALPACAAPVEAITTPHYLLTFASIFLGVTAPLAVFAYRHMRAAFPAGPRRSL
jgi:hypothetical protein